MGETDKESPEGNVWRKEAHTKKAYTKTKEYGEIQAPSGQCPWLKPESGPGLHGAWVPEGRLT